jgi:hypothetical protein
MKFINLTPHAITIKNNTVDVDITIAPHGAIARAEDTFVEVGFGPLGIPLLLRRRGEVVLVPLLGDPTPFPPPEEGTYFIVSGVVRDALSETSPRSDVFAPDTGASAERNEKGHILSVKNLIPAIPFGG